MQQDADSFDFFADPGSDSDAAAGASRKRLKKRATTSPSPASTAATAGTGKQRDPLTFSVLESQAPFLAEHGLSAAALLLLFDRLTSADTESASGTITLEQSSASRSALSSGVRAASLLLQDFQRFENKTLLVRPVTKFLGKFILRISTLTHVCLSRDFILWFVAHALLVITQTLWQCVGHLHQAVPFNDAIHQLLGPAVRLGPEDVLRAPEYAVFVAHVALQALRFDSDNGIANGTESTRSEVLTEVSAAVHALRQFQGQLCPLWEASVEALQSTRFGAVDRAAEQDGDSELPGSDPMSESAPIEDIPFGTGSSARAAMLAHMEFLLQFRSLQSVVCACAALDGTVPARGASVTTAVSSTQLDAALAKLFTRRLGGQAAMVSMAQSLTVAMLEAQFLRTVKGAASFGAVPLAEVPLIKAVLSVLELAYSPKSPGSMVATMALCRFVKYAALLQPSVRVLILISVVVHAVVLCL
jgi:hypothetical protein